MAEYSTQTPQTTPVTRYLTSDHLGSPRIITGSNGAVLSRRDFMPYGEEAYIGVGNRAVGHGYTYGDSTRQKFTGYQRDEETNLDYAQARMYSNQLGRFTTVDLLLSSGIPETPQTWNRYIYVLNNPLILVDSTGLIGDYYDQDGTWLFTDNINDDRVYVATATTLEDGSINYAPTELNVTHTQFKIIANIVRQEGATDDANEYFWIAHAANNRANTLSKSLHGLLMTSYSSVDSTKKTGLSSRDGSFRANAARAGVIDVLTGGADPTSGAQFWDGTDFLARGESHSKFKQYDSILIREDVFNSYLSSQQASSVRLKGRQYTLPAESFNQNRGSWTLNGSPESGFVYRPDRKKKGILYATGTAGKSIFWSTNYEWTN